MTIVADIIHRVKEKHGYELTRLCKTCYYMHQSNICPTCASEEFFNPESEEKIEAFLDDGYTEQLPTKSGLYWVVCNESDYEPYMCKVQNGYIGDPDLGTIELDQYDLTDLLFKRVVVE